MSLRHLPAILVAAVLSLAASFTPSSAALIHDFECKNIVFDCTGTLTLAEPMVGDFELFGLDFESLMFSISGSPTDVKINAPFGFDAPTNPWALDEGSITATFPMYFVGINITGPNVMSIEVSPISGNSSYRETAILTPVHDVPEPAILALFGMGLVGLSFAARRKTKAQS